MNIRMRLAILLLALTLIPAGCGDSSQTGTADADRQGLFSLFDREEEDTDAGAPTEGGAAAPAVQSEAPVASRYNPRELTAEETSLLQTRFSIPTAALEGAQDAIAAYTVSYPYEELYATQQYQAPSYTPSVQAGTIIQNGVVNADRLYAAVIENNRAYQERYQVNAYTGTTDAFVRESCSTIARQVTDFLAAFATIDRNALEEKLQNLTVFSYTGGFGDGVYNSANNRLQINLSLANEEVINHEVVHLLQAASGAEIAASAYEERLGYVTLVQRESINPFYWLWFAEGAAESLSMWYNDRTEPDYYTTECRMIEAFKLATLQPGPALEATLLGRSIDPLYTYFGAQSAAGQAEVRKLFYAVTLLLDDLPGKEGLYFRNVLEEEHGVDLSDFDAAQAFEGELTGCAALTQSKLFYHNLCGRLAGQSITLEELFQVISVFEIEISRQTWYQSEHDLLGDFVPGYTQMQSELFQAAASAAGLTLEQVQELYYQFNRTFSSDQTLQIPWLSAEQNELLSHINQTRAGNRKDAILKLCADYYGA